MHSNATKDMIVLASKSETGFAPLVKSAVEAGIVVPSILRKKLEDEGFVVSSEKLPAGVRVRIHGRFDKLMAAKHPKAVDFHACETRDPKATPPAADRMLLVAQAISHDEADAVVQAVYAEMRHEEEAAK